MIITNSVQDPSPKALKRWVKAGYESFNESGLAMGQDNVFALLKTPFKFAFNLKTLIELYEMVFDARLIAGCLRDGNRFVRIGVAHPTAYNLRYIRKVINILGKRLRIATYGQTKPVLLYSPDGSIILSPMINAVSIVELANVTTNLKSLPIRKILEPLLYFDEPDRTVARPRIEGMVDIERTRQLSRELGLVTHRLLLPRLDVAKSRTQPTVDGGLH